MSKPQKYTAQVGLRITPELAQALGYINSDVPLAVTARTLLERCVQEMGYDLSPVEPEVVPPAVFTEDL